MRCYTMLPAIAGLIFTSALSAQKVKTIVNNGPTNNRYDIVILGDGYQASEEAKFDAHALAASNKLFSKVSYGVYKKFFNVHTVFRASKDSGADHPDKTPPIVKDTVYDASYNFGGTPRCLYIKNQSQASTDSRFAPDVEGRVMVLVNDTRYGGCGGTYSVSYTGSSGPEVQAHEFGHSFGRLADEYDYGRSGTYSGPEPSSANLTKDSTGKAKWPLWVGTNGVSAFLGGGYYKTGLYRPKSNCLMRALGVALCPVCNEQIVKQAYVTVDPIENKVPASSSVTVLRPKTQVFSFSNLVPGAVSIQWEVNGIVVASGSPVFSWNTSAYSVGKYTIKVIVADKTSLVRKDPSNLLVSSTTWNVDLKSGSTKPGIYTTFGTGCPGSVKSPATCVRMNDTLTNNNLDGRVGVTYAVRATAPSALDINGLEFNTSSKRTGSVVVNIEVYAETAGKPGAKLATGTMNVGSAIGWYKGTFASVAKIAKGQNFYVALVFPNPTITTSIVTGGTNTAYFRNDGVSGAWTGPYTSYAWTYRVSCVSGGRVPALGVAGVPEIGTSFAVKLDGAVPNAKAFLLLGASNTTWNGLALPFDLKPMGGPGCRLLSSAEFMIPTSTNTAGMASVTLQVPNVPTLVDGLFYNQFYVFDANANPLGLAWTNGGAGKIGKQ